MTAMTPIVARWEWRSFGESFGSAESVLTAQAPERVHETDELYLLSPESNASVKVRDSLMDVKQLEHINDDGLEQWRPVMKAPFPLGSADVRLVWVRSTRRLLEWLPAYSPEDLAGLALTVPVHKRRTHYRFAGCLAELSEAVSASARSARSSSRARTPSS